MSPTLAAQLQAVLAKFPAARWHQFEPVSRDAVRAGARLAFGETVNTIHRVEAADVIVSLGSDFLTTGPGAVRYAREFASRRRAETPATALNRLYAVEATPTLTGAMADHRLVVRPDELEAFARGLAGRLGIDVGGHAWRPTPEQAKWVDALARDLTAHRGASLVVAGDEQSPAVHLLAHAMNRALGNHGRTVVFTDPIEAVPVDQGESLGQLVADMQAGKVETLLILGGNPVYTAPADVPFAEALDKVAVPRAPRPLRGRDLGALPLAPARGALPRGLERRAGVRRHGEHPAAADRAALRGTVGARGGVGAAGRPAVRIRHRPGLLEEPAPQRRLRDLSGARPCTTA